MAAPVVPQSWSNFEKALAAQGRNFEGIKGATNRNATITAVMGNTILQLDRDEINTEWARRVDAPANQGLELKMDEMKRDLLQALQDNQSKSIPLSKISQKKIQELIDAIGMEVEEFNEVVELEKKFEFRPYKWGARQDDPGENLKATQHLTSELQRFGVEFGRGKFKIVSVENQHLFKDIRLGRFKLSGKTDAIVVPYKVAGISYTSQIRVIIEFKTKEELNETDPQVIGELLCALKKSNHVVLAVKTDLESRFDFWTPVDGIYQEWRCDNCNIAIQHLARYIQGSDPDPHYKVQDLKHESMRTFASIKLFAENSSGGLTDQLDIIDDLSPDERLPFYIQTMYA